jgi:uncharacterized protein YoxC
MTLTGIVLIIIVSLLGILVFTLVPTILALKRAAVSFGQLSDMVGQELKPVIRELREVLVDMKTVGSGVAGQADDVRRFMAALGEAGDNLHTINRSVGVVTGILNTTSAWAAGIKVAGSCLLERYLKKRGGR